MMGDVIDLKQRKDRMAADVIAFIGDGIRGQIEKRVQRAVGYSLRKVDFPKKGYAMTWTAGGVVVNRPLGSDLDFALDSMEALEPFTRKVVNEVEAKLRGFSDE